MAVYLSTGAFRTRKLPEIITKAKNLGLTHLELSSGVEHFPDLDAFVPDLKASGMRLLVHNYFPAPATPFVLNLGALEADSLAASRSHVRRCLELTRQLGGKYYSVHSAFVLRLTADVLGKPEAQARLADSSGLPDRKQVRSVFVESLRDLSAEAASYGLSLLVENNVVSPRYLRLRGTDPFLMTTAEEIESVLAEVGAPNLGLLLDVGHARVSANALGFDAGAFVERLRPLIRALHLSDNDTLEDQNLPFHKESWFWPHLRGLGHLDTVIEVYTIDDETMMSQLELARYSLQG